MSFRFLILWATFGWLFFSGLSVVAHGESSTLEIRYRVRFSGVEDRALLQDLKLVSDLVNLRRRPPHSMRQLQRRMQRDKARFTDVLRTYGFYDARVTGRINAERDPVRVRFEIDTGPQYQFRTVMVEGPADFMLSDMIWTELDWAEVTGLTADQPALASSVVRAEDRIAQFLQRHGYPLPQVMRRRAYIEHHARAMDVMFWVDPGPSATFGNVAIEGLTRVEEAFVRAKIPWSEGDTFNGELLRATQRRLSASDLFATVRWVKGDALDETGQLPMRLQLTERKHRSLTLGGGYRSDEGARTRFGWEHRNLAGKGERLQIGATVSEIGYGAEARFQKPDFRRQEQTLSLTLRAAVDYPDAFTSRSSGILLGLDRVLRPQWLGGVGAGFKYAFVEQEESDERFGLLYFPFQLAWDRSDDLLDPRRGSRVLLHTAPYRDMINTEVVFLKSRAALTLYQPLTRKPTIDWAGRAVIGGISGTSREGIPADERFYAGGGGTVRGYAYQSVGPLEGKAPLGGKSLALLSSELRWRINREFGLVAFIDGGQVYETSAPGSLNDFLWGTGLGFRYFTPVGPLRFDIAIPLDRRAGVDDAYQFYISLGQAF